MPITQSRMIALIAAADDFHQAFDRICEVTKRTYLAASEGLIDPLEALSNLAIEAEPHIKLANALGSMMTIELEKKHFSLATQRRNTKAAHKMREDRPPTDKRLQFEVPLPIAHRPSAPAPTTAPPAITSQLRYGQSVEELVDQSARLQEIAAESNADLESMDDFIQVDGIDDARRIALDREIEEASKMLEEGGEEE